MKQYYQIFIISIVALFLAGSCGNSDESSNENSILPDQLIFVSQKQIDSEDIKIGELTTVTMEEIVKCNGYIMAPSTGIAQLSTPVSGIVTAVKCVLGEYVKKGQVLCMISSNEMISVQQEYGESYARLKRLKADFERSKSLYEEEIGAEKEFMAAESEYRTMLARCQALKLRLELLKLNVPEIENGKLSSAFPIVAPISGYVTNLDLVLGQFSEQQKVLAEIVDISLLQLELSVFEADIAKLKTGQNITFNPLGEKASSYTATLISVGKSINEKSKTVVCIADITSEKSQPFINNSYVEASIVVNKYEAQALPTGAILKSGYENFVFVVEKSDNEGLYVRKVKVTSGNNYRGFTEIKDGDVQGKILVNGIYNLQSE